jgi:acetyl esterase/lipase
MQELIVKILGSICAAFAAFSMGVPVPASALDSPPAAGQRYLAAIFEVRKTADIVFGQARNADGVMQSLTLDLYEPEGDPIRDRPVVIWVHGGGFTAGDKTESGPMEDLARRGYIAISIDYRLRPGRFFDISDQNDPEARDAVREASEDALTAARWVRANASGLGMDFRRVAIGGVSAGAIISLTASQMPKEGDSYPRIRLAISISGASDPRLVAAGASPAIFFHGEADTRIPIAYALAAYNALVSAGVWAEFHSYPGVGHGVPQTDWLPSVISALYARVLDSP